MTDALTTRLEGPSPAIRIALDLVRRGAVISPVLILAGAGIWGIEGAAGVAYGLAIVLLNFLVAAAMLGYAARISVMLMAAAALFGFGVRLGLMFVAVYLVRNEAWLDMVALATTLIVTHIGLLLWELKYVSGSLAHPGLKPTHRSASPAGER